MAESKKFTTEELKEIAGLQEKSRNAIGSFGTVEVELIITNQRLEKLSDAKQNLLKEYEKLQAEEVELVKKLNEKYGAGTVDLESGEFIPVN